MCFLHRKNDENYQHCTTPWNIMKLDTTWHSWNLVIQKVSLKFPRNLGWASQSPHRQRLPETLLLPGTKLSELPSASNMQGCKPKTSQAMADVSGILPVNRPRAQHFLSWQWQLEGRVLTRGQVESLDVFEYLLDGHLLGSEDTQLV